MKPCASIPSFRARRGRALALCIFGFIIVFFASCSALKQAKEKAAPAQPAAESEAEPEPAPQATSAAPIATVHLTYYAHHGDYLGSLAVEKFATATLIPAENEKKAGAALVRFDGGEPVWEIAADRGVSGSVLQHVPGVDENKKFALSEVTYGVLPKHFAKLEPDNSDPEPLEIGKYYIFTVRRGFGSIDYQAVHIDDDGSIEDYEAQPRVGTSYELCCNLSPGFASSAPQSGGADSGGDRNGEP
jgi:hypothetical protein